MKTVFDKDTREELIDRLNSLTENHKSLWGKMTVCQMIRHCRLWEEMIHQNKQYKRVFIGRLLGKMLLKKEMQSAGMRKNAPSISELIVNGNGIALSEEKRKLISLLSQYADYLYPDYSFVHPFFGKMTKAQIGYFAYKHLDHHLRQFNS